MPESCHVMITRWWRLVMAFLVLGDGRIRFISLYWIVTSIVTCCTVRRVEAVFDWFGYTIAIHTVCV